MPLPIPKGSTSLRLFSAFVGLAALAGVLYWLGGGGLRLLCLGAVVIGTRELMRILFQPDDSRFIRALFFLLMVTLFAISSNYPSMSGLAFSYVSIFFFSASLWNRKRFSDLHALTQFQAKSILGFLYLGLLPAFAYQIIDLRRGESWFMSLLTFVFSGDSAAYFCGRWFGRTPLLPEISPKKTVEGALGGLVGSLLAGAVWKLLYSDLPGGAVIAMAGLAGLVGQMGDLFESSLKRVANQKDSGEFLPGHGGALDRIDGLLFAAPVVLLGAQLIERGLN
ncbi:MAG: phosphatidate cytidylyltransferase [Bdellovibrio sp.]|nr:MAG: phosphatidate cytidylyltransferase [Bdellovibrio sp.]